MRAPTAEHPVLLIPGPTEVHPDVAAAATTPMIGHRGEPIHVLLQELMPGLRELFGTARPVLPLTCSATGAMEASMRNLGSGRVLHLVNGAFSERWSEVRASCGMEGDCIEVEWGAPIDPADVHRALDGTRYDAVTVVHSETSTGVLNPLDEIAGVVAQHDDVLLMVDAVTSLGAVAVDVDRRGIDLCFSGSQKALALSPGLTPCTVSERMLDRARRTPDRGTYFDLVAHAAALEKWETPSTPAIALLYQLRIQLARIGEEGLDARFARHRALQTEVETWARGRFDFLPAEGHRTPIVSVVRMPEHDVKATLAAARRRGWWIGAGYGRTRDDVLRIGHLGDIDLATLRAALADLDASLIPRTK